jgi:cell wall-associated NlpC family hydrolase
MVVMLTTLPFLIIAILMAYYRTQERLLKEETMKHLCTHGHLLMATIILVTTILSPHTLTAYKAVVTVPITDLVGSPLPTYHESSVQSYQQLPLCGATHQPFIACPRMHQALFNQYVEVIQERGDQVYVMVPNVFYVPQQSNLHHNHFWTLKCSITPVHTLEKQGINLQTFPSPITATTNTVPHKDIVTLTQPFHDTITGLTFSAGTRFVRASSKQHAHMIRVYRYDKADKTVSTMLVPEKQCIISSLDLTPHERVQQFVALARQWAHQSDGVIPYVWGGCSYIERSKPRNFTEVTIHNEQPYSYYVRPDCAGKPLSGLDCSGLICLAAQCCGIPYFLKNSTTVEQELRPVTKDETIIEGDIIWIPKHVMIVGSLKNNTLIEARHYAQGYGRVHELPLSAVFKDIKTYQDLHQACVHKKPLIRLDSDGNTRETIYECKILHIMSVFAT